MIFNISSAGTRKAYEFVEDIVNEKFYLHIFKTLRLCPTVKYCPAMYGK